MSFETVLGSVGGWMISKPFARVLSLLSIILVLSDYSLDCKITHDYGNWNLILKKYNITCNALSTNVELNPSSCSIYALDPQLAKIYSISILVSTHLLQFLFLIWRIDTFKTMLYYLIGSCCSGRTLTKSKKYMFGLAIIIVGLCLPFVSKMYIHFVMAINCFRLWTNKEKYQILKKHNLEGRFPVKPVNNLCNYCKDCDNTQCFCLHCGCVSKDSMYTTTNKYSSRLKELECNLMDLEAFNRYVSCSIEDTFMPLLQTYMIVPEIAAQIHSPPPNLESSPNSLLTQIIFYSPVAWTILSVVLSIIGQSMAIADLHFARRKKEYIGRQIASKALFTLTVIFQVSSRLVIMVMLALVTFPDSPYTPLYTVSGCMCHILMVFIVKICIKWRYNSNFNKLKSFANTFLCAFASVNVFVKGEFIEDEFHQYDDKLQAAYCSKQEEKDFQKRTKNGKFYDRFYFTLIIWFEQICMYSAIWYIWATRPYPEDLTMSTFFPLSLTVFLLGQTLEWLVHLLVFPFAKFRARYELRKKLLFASVLILLATAVVLLAWEASRDYPDLLIPILVFTSVMVISLTAFFLNTICCATSNNTQKDDHLEKDALSNASGSYASLCEYSDAKDP